MLGREATWPGAATDTAPVAGGGRAQRASPSLARRVRWGGFFLETEALRESLDSAREALGAGDALLVEGESGAGKTVFLAHLARASGAVCHIELRHPLGEAALCARLARSFGVADGAANGLGTLAARIATRSGTSGDAAPLVLVDDAQRLSPFALRMLLDLRAEVQRRGGRLGIAVSAPPEELDRHLAMLPSFAGYREAFTRHVLPRLTREETREYLRLALETAGEAATGETFDDARIGVLQRVSGGLPGQVNRAAVEMMGGGKPSRYRQRRHTALRLAPGLKPTRRWAMPAGVTLGLLGGVYLAWAVLFGAPADPRQEIASFSAPVAMEIPPAGAMEPTFADAAADAPTSPSDADPPPALVAAPPVRTPAQQAAPQPIAAAPPALPGAAQPVTTAPPATAATSSPRPAPDLSGLSDRDWLLAQDPARYTIQLASAPNEEKAAEFIDKYALRGRTVAVEAVRGSGSYYIVLYNSYATNAEAARGIESLPQALRKNDPFARRIASVRAMMKEG